MSGLAVRSRSAGMLACGCLMLALAGAARAQSGLLQPGAPTAGQNGWNILSASSSLGVCELRDPHQRPVWAAGAVGPVAQLRWQCVAVGRLQPRGSAGQLLSELRPDDDPPGALLEPSRVQSVDERLDEPGAYLALDVDRLGQCDGYDVRSDAVLVVGPQRRPERRHRSGGPAHVGARRAAVQFPDCLHAHRSTVRGHSPAEHPYSAAATWSAWRRLAWNTGRPPACDSRWISTEAATSPAAKSPPQIPAWRPHCHRGHCTAKAAVYG